MRLLACTIGFAAVLSASSALAQNTTRISVDSAGGQSNGFSLDDTAVSGDGRLVVFASAASNLVPNDTNSNQDVFIHDRLTGVTMRVSVDAAGGQSNGWSGQPCLSRNGQWVAFLSHATNLVSGDTNGIGDIFIRHLASGQVERASLDSLGGQANDSSYQPSISDDGTLIAFYSYASNLVSGDTNGVRDIFVRNRQLGITLRASENSGGGQANGESMFPCISGDGRFVSFHSTASNLVSGDTNGVGDIFSRDLLLSTTTRISVNSSGGQSNNYSTRSTISRDGTFMAFDSAASNLVSGDTNGAEDIFVHDLRSGVTSRVSVASSGSQALFGPSDSPSITSDGRYVAFDSEATNLVPADTNQAQDVFIHDRFTGSTTRLSVDSVGIQANNGSWEPSISDDGTFISFTSWASNLVLGDSNNVIDVFVRDRGPQPPVLLRTGACPGPVTLTVADATPSSLVVLVYGPAGVFIKPSGACAGLTLAISPPTVGATRTTDASGGAALTFPAPPGACGLTIQAVDAATCTPTNALVL